MVTTGKQTLETSIKILYKKDAEDEERVDAYQNLLRCLHDGLDDEDDGSSVNEYKKVFEVILKDVHSQSEAVVREALSVLCLLLHQGEISDVIERFLFEDCLAELLKTVRSTPQKAICIKAILCLSNLEASSGIFKNNYLNLKDLLSTCLLPEKDLPYQTAEIDGLLLLNRLVEKGEVDKVDWIFWLELVFPYLFHEQQEVRKAAVDLCRALRRLVPHSPISDAIKTGIQEKYCKRLSLLIKSNQSDWLDVWGTLLVVLGKALHHGAALINVLLEVEEKAFKSSDMTIRVQAFIGWKCLIDNFAMDPAVVTNPKRVKLLTVPLKASNAKNECIAKIKFEVWWHLIQSLKKTLEHNIETVIIPFLNFCFGPLGNTPFLSVSMKEDTEPEKYISTMAPGRRFGSLQNQCADSLIHILSKIGPVSANSLTGGNFSVKPLEVSEIPGGVNLFVKYCKPLMNSVGECSLLLAENPALYPKVKHLWKVLMAQVTRVIKRSEGAVENGANKRISIEITRDLLLLVKHMVDFATEKEHLANICLVVMETLVCGEGCLPDAVLTSPEYYPEAASKKEAIPALMLTDFMLTTAMLKLNAKDIRYFMVLKAVLPHGIGSSPNSLAFVQEVVQKLRLRTVISNITPATLCDVWCAVATLLDDYLNKTGEVNQGNHFKHDFGCIFSTLMYPVQNLLNFDAKSPSMKSMVKIWSSLYKTCFVCSEMVATTEDNEFCIELCKHFIDTVKQLPKSLVYLNTLMQIVLAFVETTVEKVYKPKFEKFSPSKWSRNIVKPAKHLSSIANLLCHITLGISPHEDTNSAGYHDVAVSLAKSVECLYSGKVNVQKLISELTTPLVMVLKTKPDKSVSGIVLSEQVTNLWYHITETIQQQYEGKYDTEFLLVLTPVLEVTFQHSCSKIVTRTKKFWRETFSSTSNPKLKIPPMLASCVKTAFLGSETSQGLSQSSEDNTQQETSIKLSGSFLSKIRRRSENPSLLKMEHPSPKSEKPKKMEFVHIPPTKKTLILTEHQKEKLRERSVDIPALYQDLSQDVSQTIPDTFSETEMERPTALEDCIENAGKVSSQETKSTRKLKDEMDVDDEEVSHLKNSVSTYVSSANGSSDSERQNQGDAVDGNEVDVNSRKVAKDKKLENGRVTRGRRKSEICKTVKEESKSEKIEISSEGNNSENILAREDNLDVKVERDMEQGDGKLDNVNSTEETEKVKNCNEHRVLRGRKKSEHSSLVKHNITEKSDIVEEKQENNVTMKGKEAEHGEEISEESNDQKDNKSKEVVAKDRKMKDEKEKPDTETDHEKEEKSKQSSENYMKSKGARNNSQKSILRYERSVRGSPATRGRSVAKEQPTNKGEREPCNSEKLTELESSEVFNGESSNDVNANKSRKCESVKHKGRRSGVEAKMHKNSEDIEAVDREIESNDVQESKLNKSSKNLISKGGQLENSGVATEERKSDNDHIANEGRSDEQKKLNDSETNDMKNSESCTIVEQNESKESEAVTENMDIQKESRQFSPTDIDNEDKTLDNTVRRTTRSTTAIMEIANKDETKKTNAPEKLSTRKRNRDSQNSGSSVDFSENNPCVVLTDALGKKRGCAESTDVEVDASSPGEKESVEMMEQEQQQLTASDETKTKDDDKSVIQKGPLRKKDHPRKSPMEFKRSLRLGARRRRERRAGKITRNYEMLDDLLMNKKRKRSKSETESPELAADVNTCKTEKSSDTEPPNSSLLQDNDASFSKDEGSSDESIKLNISTDEEMPQKDVKQEPGLETEKKTQTRRKSGAKSRVDKLKCVSPKLDKWIIRSPIRNALKALQLNDSTPNTSGKVLRSSSKERVQDSVKNNNASDEKSAEIEVNENCKTSLVTSSPRKKSDEKMNNLDQMDIIDSSQESVSSCALRLTKKCVVQLSKLKSTDCECCPKKNHENQVNILESPNKTPAKEKIELRSSKENFTVVNNSSNAGCLVSNGNKSPSKNDKSKLTIPDVESDKLTLTKEHSDTSKLSGKSPKKADNEPNDCEKPTTRSENNKDKGASDNPSLSPKRRKSIESNERISSEENGKRKVTVQSNTAEKLSASSPSKKSVTSDHNKSKNETETAPGSPSKSGDVNSKPVVVLPRSRRREVRKSLKLLESEEYLILAQRKRQKLNSPSDSSGEQDEGESKESACEQESTAADNKKTKHSSVDSESLKNAMNNIKDMLSNYEAFDSQKSTDALKAKTIKPDVSNKSAEGNELEFSMHVYEKNDVDIQKPSESKRGRKRKNQLPVKNHSFSDLEFVLDDTIASFNLIDMENEAGSDNIDFGNLSSQSIDQKKNNLKGENLEHESCKEKTPFKVREKTKIHAKKNESELDNALGDIIASFDCDEEDCFGKGRIDVKYTSEPQSMDIFSEPSQRQESKQVPLKDDWCWKERTDSERMMPKDVNALKVSSELALENNSSPVKQGDKESTPTKTSPKKKKIINKQREGRSAHLFKLMRQENGSSGSRENSSDEEMAYDRVKKFSSHGSLPLSPSITRLVRKIKPTRVGAATIKSTVSESNADTADENIYSLYTRHKHSPNASPSASILKKRLDLSMEDSPSPPSKKRRVSFAEPVVSHEIQIPSTPSHRRKLQVNRCLLPKDSVNINSLEESSGKEYEACSLNGIETQGSVEEVFPELLNDDDPIFPRLLACKASVEEIAADLSSPVWAKRFMQELYAKKIYTIGDLSALSEYQVNNLPIKSPKVQTLKSVLEKYCKVNSINETSFGAVDDCAIATPPPKLVPALEDEGVSLKTLVAEKPLQDVMDIIKSQHKENDIMEQLNKEDMIRYVGDELNVRDILEKHLKSSSPENEQCSPNVEDIANFIAKQYSVSKLCELLSTSDILDSLQQKGHLGQAVSRLPVEELLQEAVASFGGSEFLEKLCGLNVIPPKVALETVLKILSPKVGVDYICEKLPWNEVKAFTTEKGTSDDLLPSVPLTDIVDFVCKQNMDNAELQDKLIDKLTQCAGTTERKVPEDQVQDSIPKKLKTEALLKRLPWEEVKEFVFERLKPEETVRRSTEIVKKSGPNGISVDVIGDLHKVSSEMISPATLLENFYSSMKRRCQSE